MISGRPASAPPDRMRGLGHGLLFVAAAAFALAVLWHFHDRFWWPPDEGAYAHVADRILAGEVLNRDVQDLHPGYINLANAAALWAFGHDLLSLRYPLAALAFTGSCLIFLLLLPRGGLIALAGSIGFTSLSLVQFLNPTANWYSLFIFLLIVAALTWLPMHFPLRLEVLGFLVVLLALFRQPGGVFVAIGVVAYLLTEDRGPAPGATGRAGRMLIAAMALALGAYLVAKADPATLVMFGVWPMLALSWAWFATRAGSRRVLGLAAHMAVGGAIAGAPLIAYHLMHGSLRSWFQDAVLAAIDLTNLGFIDAPSFALLSVLGLHGLLGWRSLAESINGAFWLLLPLLPLVLGVSTIRALWRGHGTRHVYPLPFLALFYGLVSIHYQIPIYLFYTVAVTLAGILWFAGSWRGMGRFLAPALAVLLSISALYYQAAQPLSRGLAGIIDGDRIELSPEPWGERVALHVDEADISLYGHLLAAIDAQVAPDEKILALPFNPELYFLSGRRNPFRFGNSAIGIRDDQALAAALATLARERPRIVFYRPDDKYNTAASRALIDRVRLDYELLETHGGFEIYRLPDDGAPDAEQVVTGRSARPDARDGG